MDKAKFKILIIDDEPMYIKMLYKGLKQDFQILGVLSGNEGVGTAIKELPDLILLDIIMKGIDGYEVLKHLRANDATKHIPVVFLSGLGDAVDESYGISVGAQGYISKPFNLYEVKSTIENLLNE